MMVQTGNWVPVALAGVAVGMALAACGSSNSSNNAVSGTGGSQGNEVGGSGGFDGGKVDVELQSFCESVGSAVRSRIERCTGVPESLTQTYLGDPCAIVAPAVASGRVNFNATDAATCIADLRALACDADTGAASCDRVLSGLVDDGKACKPLRLPFITECAVGSICVQDGASCSGTCTKRPLLGQQCATNVECASGTTCSASTELCDTKGAANAACGIGAILECQPGLACSDFLAGGVCTALVGQGQTCSESVQCQTPLLCDRGADITGTCQPPPKAGDACTVGEYKCSGLGYCGSDNKCHAQPGIGQPCGSNDGERVDCVFGTCDTTASPAVCKPIPAGQACRGSSDCGPNALCIFDSATAGSVCTPPCM